MAARPALIVSYAGVLGGAERVLIDCATRLARPAVLACPDGALAVAARAAGLAVTPVPERSLRLRGAPAAHLRAIGGLARDVQTLLDRERPAALVAWGARAVLAAGILSGRARPPAVAVHHDLLPSPAVAFAVRGATRRAALVVAASEAIAHDLQCAREVLVLHPGVDLRRFFPAPPPRGPQHALTLGAVVAWKRPDLALEVAARVPGLRLTLAGAPLPGADTRLLDRLRARADAPDLAGRVAFAGALADPRPALAAAHVLLHCADAEPYGLALVEALACGRPVVAPAAAGPLEIVDGGGRLYPPGDPDAAASAVAAVLADPAAPAAARARAEAAFDVEESGRRFADALERLAA